jgi:UDP-glucose 4-epimerase
LKHALITGGAGFIGSHLAEYLLNQQIQVTVVDNLATGLGRNIEHLHQRKGFKFVQLDVADRAAMAPIVANCTELYHLASYVGVKLVSTQPTHTILSNFRAIDVLLDLVSHYRPKFLLASTSEVYGKAMDLAADTPLSENADRVYGATSVNRWCYAGVKAMEEFLTLAQFHESGIHSVAVRPFNVIGERQRADFGMVVPRFMQQALKNEPITLYGEGNQTRCFTYVGDVVKAMDFLLNHPETGGELYNVGQVYPTTIKALAELIIQKTGSTSKVVHIPYQQAYENGFEDINTRIPDISKLKSLGFTPTLVLPDIIDRIIAHESA